MTESLVVPKSYTKSKPNQRRWQFYTFLGLIINAVLWSSALLYLKLTPPTYTSYSAIDVPGTESNANVSLPEIGQASYQNTSPYAFSSSQDPRENYKFIAQSKPVLKAAATQLGMSVGEYGQPRIKVVHNTTIMEIEFKGASPKEAQNKSLAFYRAFEARLNEMRIREAVRRDVGSQTALASSQRKLEVARNRLYAYKDRSDLSSDQQIKDLVGNIEQLRKQKAEIESQHQQASTNFNQLSADLNLSAQQAVDAFVLQTDQLFQQNLKEYSDASTALTVLSAKFLPNHPDLLAAKAKRDTTQTALLTRSNFLLKRSLSQADLEKFLNLSGINSGTARENLFQQLITLQAQRQGLQAQAQTINRHIAQLESRHKQLTRQESTLDALKRDMQMAEAVFSSTATKLDIGKSNAFGSYPLIQPTVEPSLPDAPSEPKTTYVVLSGTLASVFSTAGLVLLWLRDRKTSIDE